VQLSLFRAAWFKLFTSNQLPFALFGRAKNASYRLRVTPSRVKGRVKEQVDQPRHIASTHINALGKSKMLDKMKSPLQ
jgi:hypothetical protein